MESLRSNQRVSFSFVVSFSLSFPFPFDFLPLFPFSNRHVCTGILTYFVKSTSSPFFYSLSKSSGLLLTLRRYARMGIPDANWRISTSNQFYKLCSSYPRVLVVPAKISDSQLKEVKGERREERRREMEEKGIVLIRKIGSEL